MSAVARRPLRRRFPAGRRAPRASSADTGLRAVALLAAAVLAFSPFLPWYSTDLGAVFTDGSASGWSSTVLAQIIVLVGALAGVAAGLLALDQKDLLDLGPEASRIAAAATPVAGAVALVLVAFRAIVLPEDSDFLTLDWGIYVAVASAALTTAVGWMLLVR